MTYHCPSLIMNQKILIVKNEKEEHKIGYQRKIKKAKG